MSSFREFGNHILIFLLFKIKKFNFVVVYFTSVSILSSFYLFLSQFKRFLKVLVKLRIPRWQFTTLLHTMWSHHLMLWTSKETYWDVISALQVLISSVELDRTRKGTATRVLLFWWCEYMRCVSKLTLERTSKLIPPPWYPPPPPLFGFHFVPIFLKDGTFTRKPVISSTRWGVYYGVRRWWGPLTSLNVAAIFTAILDFTKIENLTGKVVNKVVYEISESGPKWTTEWWQF